LPPDSHESSTKGCVLAPDALLGPTSKSLTMHSCVRCLITRTSLWILLASLGSVSLDLSMILHHARNTAQQAAYNHWQHSCCHMQCTLCAGWYSIVHFTEQYASTIQLCCQATGYASACSMKQNSSVDISRTGRETHRTVYPHSRVC
jgi:hypothetical protein